MGYLAGSHVVGLKKFVNIFEPEKALDILSLPQFKDAPPTWVEVPRGGVAFHHGLTVHLATPNSGAHTRRVHTMILFRDGTTRGSQFQHFAVDRYGIKIGEPIDSPVTPIAWPRAAGDLPDPPSVPIGDLHASFGVIGTFPETPSEKS